MTHAPFLKANKVAPTNQHLVILTIKNTLKLEVLKFVFNLRTKTFNLNASVIIFNQLFKHTIIQVNLLRII